MKRSKSEIAEAAESLRALLASIPVDQYGKRTIHGLVRHVSASGMMREISLFAVTPDGLRDLTYYVSCVTGWGIGKKRGVRVSGCGMDMIFHLADSAIGAIGERADWQRVYRIEQI